MTLKEFFRPTKGKIIIFLVLLILGVSDWFNIFYVCESPLPIGYCTDYPFKHHPDVVPGLYPPLIFKEGCTDPPQHQKITNFVAWECRPNTFKFPGSQLDIYCVANCKVSLFSWIYTLIYWYLLSCIIVFVYKKIKK